MREFAKAFYKSKAWQRCRDGYAASVGGLCEDCLAKGLYRPGEIVHHMIELTPDNINDPAVSLSWSNLRLLCRELYESEIVRAAIHATATHASKLSVCCGRR